MKRLAVLLQGFVWLVAAQVQAAPVEKPAPLPRTSAPASAAAASASRPLGDSAVEAADKAQEPGTLRPEDRVVPQVVLPLRGDAPPASEAMPRSGAASAGQIDQSAARCAAQKTKSARQECKAASK